VLTRKQLLSSVKKTFDSGYLIIEGKNKAYGQSEDAIINFRAGEVIGITVYKAILNRILEKCIRVANLENRRDDEGDETVKDTLIDIINLSAILLAHIEYELETKTPLSSNYVPIVDDNDDD